MRTLHWTIKTVLLGAALLAGFAAFDVAGWLGIRVNLTNSLPRGWYQITREPITRGAYVVECLPRDLLTFAARRGWIEKGFCPNGAQPILKQVAAVPGDEVEVTDAYVAVNGRVLWQTKRLHLDSQGRWIPAILPGTYTMNEGEIFLVATNIPNSWDSRYTGPAKAENIVATVRPLWTEGEQ